MYTVDGEQRDVLPADDRGLQFGDGVFETIAVVDGAPALLDAHLHRLARGATALGLPAPPTDVLAREVRQLAARADGGGVVKILWTAGSGGRGYARAVPVQPRRILSLHPPPAHPPERWHDGVRVAVSEVRLARQPRLAGVKHLNRLEQVLAREQIADAAHAEALMLDDGGGVVEGVTSNLLMVTGDRVVTPALADAGVAGVMREAIMAFLESRQQPVHEEALTLEALVSADEVFLCNSVNGVWPVVALAERGRWEIGPVTRLLQAWIDRDALAWTPHWRGQA